MDSQHTITILVNEAAMCAAILTGVYRTQLLQTFQKAKALAHTATSTPRNQVFVQRSLRQTIAQAEKDLISHITGSDADGVRDMAALVQARSLCAKVLSLLERRPPPR
jgi:hypothetical protein